MITMQLVVNRIVSLQLQQGEQLFCREGVLWVTYAGHDVILHPGESLQAASAGLAVVEACSGATLVRSGRALQANSMITAYKPQARPA